MTVAPQDVHFFRPEEGHGLSGNPLKAIVGPRPIGWISTLSEAGVPNLAPYSFFTMLCDDPPLIGFASMGYKDSASNAELTGEFTYNLATHALAEAMNISSALWPSDVDEFKQAGVEGAPGRAVRCPRVAASPASLECRLTEVLRLRGLDGATIDSWLVIGQVVGVHIDKAYLTNGRFETSAAGILHRAGYGTDYHRIGPEGHFSMRRPG